MIDLVPLPYKIAGATIAAVALFLSGAAIGIKWENGRNAEALLKSEQQWRDKYTQEVNRGNSLAQQVEEAKRNIVVRTIEVIKRIPAVTSGRKCLDPGAVWLLNGTSKPTLREAARQPAGESAGTPAATDRDVAQWIASANEQYDQCASQLNALIEFNSR